jgi:hypothetical protein
MFISPLEFDTSISGSSEPIELADGSTIYSKGCGTSTIYGRAMHVPALSQSLISTVHNYIAGNFTLFGNNRVFVLDKRPIITGNMIRSGTLENNRQFLSDDEDLYLSDKDDKNFANCTNTDFIYPMISKISRTNVLESNISENEWKFIHAVTGHKPLNDHSRIIGLPKKPIRIFNIECQACILAKLKKLKTPSDRHNRPQSELDPPKYYEPFQVVGYDIVDCGSETISLQGNRYMSIFIDFHSDMTYLYYCKTMDEFLQKSIKPFFYKVINPTNIKRNYFIIYKLMMQAYIQLLKLKNF